MFFFRWILGLPWLGFSIAISTEMVKTSARGPIRAGYTPLAIEIADVDVEIIVFENV